MLNVAAWEDKADVKFADSRSVVDKLSDRERCIMLYCDSDLFIFIQS